MSSLDGKVVFITGGARGIGAEVARRLHRRGARLVLVDVDAKPLTDLVDELGGDRVLAVVADVRTADAMAHAVDRAERWFGGIDILLANAGIGGFGTVLNMDPEAFKRVIDVNMTGVLNTVHAALPSIIERRGYVLLVSSMAAFTTGPAAATYNATKAGVEHLADGLRLEVAPLGVDVGCAHMSWIDTPLVQDLRAELDAFNQLLAALPGPLSRTTSVAKCGAAFVAGIERRKRRVYCPAWVGVFRWLRPLTATSFGERTMRKLAVEVSPAVDTQAAALGRHFTSRIERTLAG
jgi:NAD(P)-dependent dehydrogenase (short-subunit alcohol dehydrogenase family)